MGRVIKAAHAQTASLCRRPALAMTSHGMVVGDEGADPMFVESTRLGMLAKLSVAADVSPNHQLWANFQVCVEGDCVAWAIRKGFSEVHAERAAEYAGPAFVDAFNACRGRFVSARAVRDQMISALTRHVRPDRQTVLVDQDGATDDAGWDAQIPVWWLEPFRHLLQMNDRMLTYLALTEVRELENDERSIRRRRHQKRKRRQSRDATRNQADRQEHYGLYDLKPGWKGRFAETVTGDAKKQNNFSDTNRGIYRRYATLNRELAEIWDRVVPGAAEPRDAVERLIRLLHEQASRLDGPATPDDLNVWLWKQLQELKDELQQAAEQPSADAPVLSDLLKRLAGRLRQPKLLPLAVQAFAEFRMLLVQDPDEQDSLSDMPLVGWLRHVPREFEDIEREPDQVLASIVSRRLPNLETDNWPDPDDPAPSDRMERIEDDRRWLRNAMWEAVEAGSTHEAILDALVRSQVNGVSFVRLDDLLLLLRRARILACPAMLWDRLDDARRRLIAWQRWLERLPQSAENRGFDLGPAWEIPSALQSDPDRLRPAIKAVSSWVAGDASTPYSWDGQACIHAAVAISYLDELADLMCSLYGEAQQ